MKIIKQEYHKNHSINTQEINPSYLFQFNPTVLKIIDLLKNKNMYPIEISKALKLHEQNIYYYIKKLEKAKIIKINEQKKINGVIANLYALASDSFFFKFNNFKESPKIIEKESHFLKPFIEEGLLNSLIIVGSPDPHGPQKARSKDGYFGMDLALFLGTFISHIPESKVKLDTEASEQDLKNNNLIIIGGYIVNKIASIINKKMPIRFDKKKKGIISSITGKVYFSDETGLINKIKSPFNREKSILLIAGNRNPGTKAAILAFIKDFKTLKSGNKFNSKINSRVVEGIDLNSDGIIDNLEFLE